jgi:Stress responsive A/B Barrel Domain
MLQHVVAITWNDQVPLFYAETVSAVLQDMASQISSVREYHCGPDLGVSTAVNADYLIVATFDDVDGWRQYDADELHNEIRAKYFKPYIASRASAQITF